MGIFLSIVVIVSVTAFIMDRLVDKSQSNGHSQARQVLVKGSCRIASARNANGESGRLLLVV
jgi:hypothetical protein